ncbi:MAG: hypothetical protein VYB06_03520, partial [Cyanobacteriota bacterium]|nr:hypothetical protein [Cyanobacteriota bacterium]
MRISAYQIPAARERLLWSHEDEQSAVFPTERPFSLVEYWNLPSDDVETLITCPGREGIQRVCPSSWQLFSLL